MQKMMELTDSIRDEFIEEAARPVRRDWSKRIAAAAAVLVLLAGGLWLLGRSAGDSEPAPLFAIRVNAADGRTKTLNEIGDSVHMKSKSSDLFPDKEVFSFTVSLDGYVEDVTELDEDRFWIFSRNVEAVTPDKPARNLAVEWLTPEKDGMIGYRITGWCEESEYVSLRIYDKEGTIVHEKKLDITYSNGYTIEVCRSFYYRADMTTDELIDESLRQDYTMELMLSSDFTGYIPLKNMCGFAQLLKRPDAGTKLLERLERMAAGEVLYPVKGGILGAITGRSNDYIIRDMLVWSEFYDMLTDEEKERLENNPLWPGYVMEPPVSHFFFTDHELFTYEILIDGLQWSDSCELEIAYNDIVTIRNTDNIVALPVSRDSGEGWEINGWFEEPTEVTLTVMDEEGGLVRRDVILITPTEDGYQIDVLETTE